jgi:hypothetical protein
MGRFFLYQFLFRAFEWLIVNPIARRAVARGCLVMLAGGLVIGVVSLLVSALTLVAGSVGAAVGLAAEDVGAWFAAIPQPWPWVGLGAILLVAVALIVGAVLRRRRGRAAPGARRRAPAAARMMPGPDPRDLDRIVILDGRARPAGAREEEDLTARIIIHDEEK